MTMTKIKAITDHVVNLPLNVSIEWDVSDLHCCEADPYEIRKPVSAAYSVGDGETQYFYFGMAEDNPIEEVIVNAIQNGEITHG